MRYAKLKQMDFDFWTGPGRKPQPSRRRAAFHGKSKLARNRLYLSSTRTVLVPLRIIILAATVLVACGRADVVVRADNGRYKVLVAYK
jgi:hypothetical protein